MKRSRTVFFHLLFACLLTFFCTAPSAAEETLRWIGPEGEFLPFVNDEEVTRFLEKAKIVEKRELSSGTTKPWKVLLERDGVQANAIFRIVDVQRERAKIEGKTHIEFHDRALYECAAYRLSRLLGIDNVPPVTGFVLTTKKENPLVEVGLYSQQPDRRGHDGASFRASVL